ncbi:cold-shock' DNA-binding domain-containing protein [Phakopsora pachyrhizi]|uniref:Cold-shock' DNA-binding domain-domain-containing protein n=1 Tax=Phakopsora pachyrhizi TaxID=170000 RepID=A0AAV0AE88_PHAPC|nr:cold-shock' DNA-binding domain-containing protein [Phakopsora pachyrhizi]CAH7665828.1 cold-shock' DNA-binding domain-domain-containing protein [Phakopsora pachyrhizi]
MSSHTTTTANNNSGTEQILANSSSSSTINQSSQSSSNHQDPRSFTNPHPVSSNEINFDISKRRKGTCKFFNSQKGFGFINDDRPQELGNQEVFVHYTSIGSKGGFRSLAEGEEVEYVLSPGQKGFQANEVTGPSGKAVQGDVKSKVPKTPTFVPYPMGIMPGGYAIAGASSPYMHQDPYMASAAHPGVYGSPYGSQVFYVPSTVGLMPAGHSPNLGGMSPYPAAGNPGAHTARSPTVPLNHHPSPMPISITSPQPNGFGFTSPSMSYGLAGPSSILGSSAGALNQAESRSPGLGVPGVGFINQSSSSFTGGSGGAHSPQENNLGLGLRPDLPASNIIHRAGGGGRSMSEDRHGGGGVGNHSISPSYPNHQHHHHQNGSSSLLYSSNNPAAY